MQFLSVVQMLHKAAGMVQPVRIELMESFRNVHQTNSLSFEVKSLLSVSTKPKYIKLVPDG